MHKAQSSELNIQEQYYSFWVYHTLRNVMLAKLCFKDLIAGHVTTL